MTTETDLLPLPAENYVDDEGLWETRYGPYSSEQMKDYARANVARAVAPLQAEIEALRAEVEEWKRVAAAQAELHDEAETRADKLEKILRAYQKAVNRLDDLIEYALPMPRETKGALYSVLANLTEELAKVNKA